MKSKSSFPISERLKKGKFKKPFNTDSFKEVYEILIRYHQALHETEKEIKENNLEYNPDEIFPKEERLPIEKMVYIGMGKLPYFHFVASVEKYHNAFEYAEKVLQEK